MEQVQLVMAREKIPAGHSVFLAGPTPQHDGPVPSWRPDALAEITTQWQQSRRAPLIVISPESRGGLRAERYEDQVDWEMHAREVADVILFWIPRDVVHMPGYTTNVEFGYDLRGQRRVVLGCPQDCANPERNRYLIYLARRDDVPVCTTLADTVHAALYALNIAMLTKMGG